MAAPSRTEDATLAARLRAGDEAALADLYDRFAGTALGVACRVTGDRHAAEEAVQETFLWIWSHADRFDAERGGLRAWIAVLVHRRAVDWLRAETVRRRTVPEPDAAPSAEDDVLEIEAERAAEQVARRVRGAVEALPEPQREVVRLLYFENRRVADIAAALGVPEGTAKTRLRAARLRLAAALAVEGLVTT